MEAAHDVAAGRDGRPQSRQSHEKKGSVGAKLDELKAMLPTGVDASQAAALISSLKAELARE